ncbi:hypothetical protein EVAR_43149_1, partial [Eumeta japonica]
MTRVALYSWDRVGACREFVSRRRPAPPALPSAAIPAATEPHYPRKDLSPSVTGADDATVFPNYNV